MIADLREGGSPTAFAATPARHLPGDVSNRVVFLHKGVVEDGGGRRASGCLRSAEIRAFQAILLKPLDDLVIPRQGPTFVAGYGVAPMA
jgi:ABC-type histidine transport system ATPase subunit